MILTLLKTIPSTSHNAPYSVELGEHWPAGQKFRLCSPRKHHTLRKYFHLQDGRVAVEQIGGEEVIVSVPREQTQELFGFTLEEND